MAALGHHCVLNEETLPRNFHFEDAGVLSITAELLIPDKQYLLSSNARSYLKGSCLLLITPDSTAHTDQKWQHLNSNYHMNSLK